jgi:hypothetical protein
MSLTTWTTDKPTTPGYYWARNPNVQDSVMVLFVYEDRVGHVLMVELPYSDVCPLASLDKEWQGPITPYP